MQWSSAPNGGFTGPNVKPWMSVNPDYAQGINAETEVADPGSTYHFYAAVLRLRKQYLDIFVYGDYKMLDRENQEIFAFVRDGKALVACNFTGKDVQWTPSNYGVKGVEKLLLSNYDSEVVGTHMLLREKWYLRPFETVVALVDM